MKNFFNEEVHPPPAPLRRRLVGFPPLGFCAPHWDVVGVLGTSLQLSGLSLSKNQLGCWFR